MNAEPDQAKRNPRRSAFIRVLFVLAVVLVGLGAWWLGQGGPAGRPDKSWERVQARGVLRVGTDASYPPFEFVDDQAQIAGFDADLARAVATRLGVRVEFVNLSYDGLYDALAAGQVDAVVSALVIDPMRMADFAYSAPYFNAGQVLVVRRDGLTPQGMRVLAGQRLAVELGSDGEVQARRWAQRLPGLVVQPWPEPAQALAAVEAGQADVALVDTISARTALRDHPALRLSSDPVTYEPYAIAVPRHSQALLEVINRALAEIQADGTLEKLLGRWL